jgi:hypothetical protein
VRATRPKLKLEPPERRRFTQVKFRFDASLVKDLDDLARKSPERGRTSVATMLLRSGLHRLAARDWDHLWRVSGAEAQIEQLDDQVSRCEPFCREIALRLFVGQALLVAFMAESRELQVTAEELRAEALAVGESAVQQLLDELRYPDGDSADEPPEDEPSE